MLNESEVEGLRWVIMVRVSTGSQRDNQSLDQQEKQTDSERKRLNGDVVDQFYNAESGTTMDRKTINKLIKMAENDGFDVLGISNIDRLSRADPWDAIETLKKFYENDIILYEANRGAYDWDDLNDFRRLVDEIVFSRKHVMAIKNGQRRGYRGLLEDGKWPYGKNRVPAGLKIDADRNLHLKRGTETVVSLIFDHYLRSKTISKTHKYVNEEILPLGEIKTLSYNQVGNILSNEFFTGKLKYKGELFGEESRLRVISGYKFNKVQRIRSSDSSNTKRKVDELGVLEKFGDFAERFGHRHTFQKVLDPFKPLCRECGAEMKWDEKTIGSAKGLDVPKFECSSCDNERNIPNTSDLDEIHQQLPLRCPYCTNTEDFAVEENRTTVYQYDYTYTCEVCGNSWGSNFSSENIPRLLNHTDLKFSLNYKGSNNKDPDIDPDQNTLDDL